MFQFFMLNTNALVVFHHLIVLLYFVMITSIRNQKTVGTLTFIPKSKISFKNPNYYNFHESHAEKMVIMTYELTGDSSATELHLELI